MPEKGPRIITTQQGQVTIVSLTDRRILDEININEIGDQLSGMVARTDDPRFVLDFASVAHMSSSALGMLITLRKRVAEKSGQLVLCNIQPAILEVFVITRLNEIFTICSSRDEAVEAVS